MAIRWYDPSEPTLERQAVSRRAFQSQRAMVTPQLAQAVTVMFRTNPNLRPGTGLALARANVDPEGPIAQAAVKTEAQLRTKKGFGWHSLGDLVSGVFTGNSRQVGQATADIATAGFGAASDLVGAAVGTGAGGVLKGISRGTWMGAESIGQTFQGAFRESTADGDISGLEWLGGLPHLKEGFAQSDIAAGHREIQREGGYLGLLTGKTDVDYGSGFFPGGDVKQDAVQRRRGAAPLVDGHAVTMGRYSAKQVFEPGSKPYGLMSGLVDATMMLASDPTSWLGGSSALHLGSSGVREATTRGRTFANSTGDVVRTTPVEMSPAKRTAKAFGDEEITAGEFLDKSIQHGSDNPAVTRTVRSLEEGLLSRDEALENLTALRPRIAVEAGLVDGLRKTVLSDVANDWLTMNARGRQTVRYLAERGSVAEMRRATGGKIDTETLVKLAATRDDNEVISVLGPLLGTKIRERPTVGGEFRVEVKDARASSRWLAHMPHAAANLEDLDDVVEQADRLGALVKMPLADRDRFVNQMAATTNRNERLQVFKDLMRHVQDEVLDGETYDAGTRQALTRLYGAFDDMDEFRTFALTELGDPMRVPGGAVMRVGDEEIALPSPHLISEHVGQYMPMPDARELRRATSKVFQTLNKTRGARRTADALIVTGDLLTGVFKVGALARLAYPLRVIGEEQARMAASGLHSAYAHPLSYLSVLTGRSAADDVLDDPFTASTALGDAMSVGSAGMFGQAGKVKVPGKFAVDRTDPQFAVALTDNLSEFHNDAIAKRVAMGGLGEGDRTPNPMPGLDGIKDWFFNGAGRAQRQLLMTGADSRGAAVPRREVFSKKFDPEDALNSSDGYIDSMVERLRAATNGDTRLMEAIATGRIDGVPLMREVAPKQFKPNPDAVRRVQALLDEGPEVGPGYAKGDRFMNPKSEDPSFAAFGRGYDAAVEKMFEYLMSKPTNYLSRSPAFKQFYWQRQAELIRYMQPEVQQAALRVARKSDIPQETLKALEKGAATRSGELTAKETDELSKAFGVDSTRKLLYDLHNRNNFWDAMRVVFPFGNAFREVASTWARISFKENPLVLHRGQQIVNGMRSANVDGEDEGLFFTNANGEESYAIPFSGWINEKVSGVDSALVGSVKGLNVFGSSVIPGLGPVITAPLAKVIPNRPEFQDFNELLFPFGEKEYTDGALGGFAGGLMPTWAQKLKQAALAGPEKDRMFANHVAYSARYLLSTGKYSLETAEEKDRLEQDAITAARKLTMLRGLAQIWSPSAPSPQYVTLDKDGQGFLQVRLVEEYQKLLNDTEGGGYKTATERFVEKFGEDAVLSIVSRTSGGAPPTEDTNLFAKKHPDVVRAYRDTYGFFLDRGGEFNYQAYKDQIASGERQTITPKEAIEIANQRLGQMVYNQYRAQVGDRPNAAQRQWLSQVRDAVETQYPGYNPTPASLRDNKLLITQMLEAAKNPVLAETDAGQGLTLYLQYRAQALEAARSRGLQTFASAKSAADLREYLREAASQIQGQHPAFGELFDRTFNREMVADDGTD